MEKIIQLTQSEYDKLDSLAKLNESKIKEEGKKLYEKLGVSSIYLSLSIEEKEDVYSTMYEKINIKPYISLSTMTNENDKLYTIMDDEQQKNFKKKIESYIDDVFAKKYGKQAKSLVYLKNLTKEQEKQQKNFKIFTYLGWTIAVTITILTILF
jgi:hypothetical protein